MGLFDAKKESTPHRHREPVDPSRAEQIAEAQALVEAEKAEAAFRQTPVGQATTALEAGHAFVEVTVEVAPGAAAALGDVEALGWTLVSSGWVHRESTDTTLGIHLFRRATA